MQRVQQVMGPDQFMSLKTIVVDFSKDVSFEDFKAQFVSKLKGKRLMKFIEDCEYENELDSEHEEYIAQVYVYNSLIDSLQTGKRFQDIRKANNSPY